MSRRVKYVCPEHKDQILYYGEIDIESARMITGITAPRVCPKCKKPYNPWQCDQVPDNDDTQ